MDKHIQLMADTYGLQAAPITAQMFGNAGKEHMEKYGRPNTIPSTIARAEDLRVEAGAFF